MPISIETLGYIAAFCTTVSFLPQAIFTIRTQNTDSLSLVMYSFFTTGVMLWLIYGINKGDDAIIWANSVTLIFAAIILAVKIKNTLSTKVNQRY